MTEEILQAAILRLESKAKESLALIKDIYHRPADEQTVDKIASQALALVQYEGASLTLRQYAGYLAQQTEAEEASNAPEEVTEVEVEEDVSNHDDLMKRSATYRKSMKGKKSES